MDYQKGGETVKRPAQKVLMTVLMASLPLMSVSLTGLSQAQQVTQAKPAPPEPKPRPLPDPPITPPLPIPPVPPKASAS